MGDIKVRIIEPGPEETDSKKWEPFFEKAKKCGIRFCYFKQEDGSDVYGLYIPLTLQPEIVFNEKMFVVVEEEYAMDRGPRGMSYKTWKVLLEDVLEKVNTKYISGII